MNKKHKYAKKQIKEKRMTIQNIDQVFDSNESNLKEETEEFQRKARRVRSEKLTCEFITSLKKEEKEEEDEKSD